MRLRGRATATAPVVVGIDLQLMQPAGANGGVKPLVFSFLADIRRAQPERFRFVYLASPELEPELLPLLQPGDRVARAGPPAPEFDVLYAPFGRSSLMRAETPTVSLIVDLLHRDLPEALPIEEVNYRHEWFTQIAADAGAFQCISHFTASRLQAHYGIEAERCFVTHIAVHERLESTAAREDCGPLPIEGPFFFYPANFWPHKNHEALLAAYRLYCDSAPVARWPLVFTGHPDARMQALGERVATLGLEGSVHFLGHLDERRFAAVWKAAGALVYPSRHEGFGIPLLEAMAFRCPIIASRATSLPEVGGDACVYVDPSNLASIAEALGRIAADEALRRDLARRGTERLRAFSLSREASKLAARLIELGQKRDTAP